MTLRLHEVHPSLVHSTWVSQGWWLGSRRRARPATSYLLAGLAGVLGMTYTAYLGGKMVYGHGVGVQPDGVRDGRSPALRMRNAGEVARVTARNTAEGVAHVARETREGRLAPALRGSTG